MTNETSIALAIVIPAFRILHLAETLESLAGQTDGRFRVYVGDDASPEPLKDVVDAFTHRLDIKYQRFDCNLGGKNLTAQWQRCISLTQGEPWLWLFSDDDVMEPECVARFFESLQHSSHTEVYRFQLDFINERSARYFRPVDHPAFETVDELLAALLTDRYQAWRAQEHIFSRRVYDRCGGFVDFPKAIFSDHATWLRFAEAEGIQTISGPRVLWRSHPSGTSSGMREANRERWQTALRLYIKWLADFARHRGGTSAELFRQKGTDFYFRELCHFHPPLNQAERRIASEFIQELFGYSWLGAQFDLYSALLRYRIARSSVSAPIRKWRMRRRLATAKRPTQRLIEGA